MQLSRWCLFLGLFVAGNAHAQAPESVADFYQGKTISIIVHTNPGGLYDASARMVATYLGTYVPGNPTVVVKNMPGSQLATAYLYNRAKKDGTELGTVERGIIVDPVFGDHPSAPQFDVTKFNWLGSPTQETAVGVVWGDTGVGSIEDAKRREVVIGATGAGTSMGQFPILHNVIAGTKFKVVYGYRSGSEINLAMERGEIDGRFAYTYAALMSQQQERVKSGKIKIISQMGYEKHRDIPDVPWLTDLARNEADRELVQLLSAQFLMGIPFLAPPGLPVERVAALRKAFQDTLKDPGFLADSAKLFQTEPVTGEQLERTIAQVHAAIPRAGVRLRELIETQKAIENEQKQKQGSRPQ